MEVKATQKKDEGAVPPYLTPTPNWTLDTVADLPEESFWLHVSLPYRWVCGIKCEETPSGSGSESGAEKG